MGSTFETTSDAALLETARNGDGEALATLLERHQGQIYRFGMKMCRDPEDARDVLQETLFAMARSVRDFRGASSLSTWLYTVARSFCIKKRRRSKFVESETSLDGSEFGESTNLVDPSRMPDEALAGKQIEVALEEAIGALESSYREVLILRDVEGLTAPEVAEILGLSTQAVKSRLHRARLQVRSGIAPFLGISSEVPAAPATCPDVLTLFSKHLEDEISAEVCIEMQSHIEGCSRCRGTCDSLKQTLALCRTSAPEFEVPPAVRHSVAEALREFLRENS